MELMSLLAKLTLDKTEYDKGLEEAEKDANGLKIPTPQIPKAGTDEFKGGLEEGEEEASVFSQVVSSVWQGLKDSLVQVGVTAVVTGLISAMREGITLVTDGGKQIAANSKNMQMSTKAYQEWDYVLGKSGLKMKDISAAMKSFNEIVKGEIGEGEKENLEAIGISAEEAASGLMTAEELMGKVMGALADYSGPNKGALIEAFFGKKDAWTGFFSQTSEDIEQLIKDSNDLGLIISDESIENAVEFNKSVESIQETITGLKQSFGESILPMITEAVKGVERVVKFLTGDRRTVSQIFGDYDKEYFKDIADIELKATQAASLIDKLISMGDPSKLTEEEFAVWKGTAEAAIELIPSLAEQIDIETGKIDGNTAALKANVEQWKALAKQKALQALYEQKYSVIAEKIAALTEEQTNLNVKEAEASAKRQKAIEMANAWLNDEEQGTYRQQITGMTEVNDSNFANALSYFSALEGEAGDAMREYNRVANEIYGIKDNIETLKKEYEESEQAFDAWSSANSEVLATLGGDATAAAGQVQGLNSELASLPDEKHIRITIDEDDYTPHAIGSAYIPYDNYPALLHRGERVLTATQARRGESGSSIDYGHLEDRIAAAIRNGMQGATVRSYINGKDVTDNVNKDISNQLKARRFRG